MKTGMYLCAGIACAAVAGSANAAFVDFEGLAAGTVVTNQLAGQGISNVSTNTTFGAMIFDSANPTGEDPDLATPVTGTVAPGATNGAFGNILIISEDGDSNDPDDNAGPGSITFDLSFTASDLLMHIIDIEEQGGSVELLMNGGSVASAPITNPGNNSLQLVSIPGVDFNGIRVNLVGSGAVGDIDFVPTPGTLALSCLGGVTFVRRRRKA